MENNGFDNDAAEDILDSIHNDGNSERADNHNLKQSDLENIFSSPQNADLARTLLEPGNSFYKLLMKGRLPNTRTLIALASLYGKCLKHNNTRIPKELSLIVAGYCAIDESRARLVSDTIIGERQRSSRVSGFGEKLKKMAFGNED